MRCSKRGGTGVGEGEIIVLVVSRGLASRIGGRRAELESLPLHGTAAGQSNSW